MLRIMMRQTFPIFRSANLHIPFKYFLRLSAIKRKRGEEDKEAEEGKGKK